MTNDRSGDAKRTRLQVLLSFSCIALGIVGFVIGTRVEQGLLVLVSALLLAGGANGLRLAGVHALLWSGRVGLRDRRPPPKT